jgi:hypothetical protein
MVNEYTEQDMVTNNFGWLTLQTYELWNNGESLSFAKEKLIPSATKNCRVGDDYYNGVVDFINNTYEALNNKNERNKCIDATKGLTIKLVFLLAKKVIKNKDRKSYISHKHAFNELLRIGTVLGVFTDYIHIGCVEHNMSYFEGLLENEMVKCEAEVNKKGGRNIEYALRLFRSIEIALKCRDKIYKKKVSQAWLIFIIIILSAIMIL